MLIAKSGGAGLTVSRPVLIVTPSDAVIVAVIGAVTVVVSIVKVAVVAPAGMVTTAGTEAAALLLDREMFVPSGGVPWPTMNTCPVAGSGPVTLTGLALILSSAGCALTAVASKI